MSVWRQKAIECAPELKNEFQANDLTPYTVFMELLPIVRQAHFDKDNDSSGHLYLMRIPGISEKQRNEIIVKMAEKGIATNVHYKPLPMLTAYKNLGFDIKNYPNAYKMYCNEITLPLNTLLTDDDVEIVVQELLKIIDKL